MKLRDLFKTNLSNDGTRSLLESILIPEVEKAFSDWKSSTLSYKAESRTDIPIEDLWNKLKIVYTKLSKDLEIGILNSKGSQFYIELVKQEKNG